MQLKEYHEVTLREFVFALDALIRESAKDLIASERWSLDDYLAAIENGVFECLTVNDINVKFHKNHTVTMTLDLNDESNNLPWVFASPIEVEVSAVFEMLLD